jgi:O-antigen/teichoic acid export membrane protein
MSTSDAGPTVSMDRGKTARSALWSLVENGGLSLISLGSLIIYTRLLSTAEFGLFSIVLALTELLQVLVTMLFHDALVQRAEVSELHFDTAFSFSLVLSAVLLLLCCAFSPLFALLVGKPGAGLVLGSMALCFPAASLGATIVARQRRTLSFRPLAIRSLVGRFAGAAGGITLVALGAGVWGLIAQQILIQLVGSLTLWATCDQRPRLRFASKEFKELSVFGLYAVGALFLTFGVKRLFTLLTGVFLGVTVAGYLNLGFRAVDVFWSIASTAATQVALPMLSSLQSDLPRLKRSFQLATGFVCSGLYLLFVGMALTAPEVVSLLFGDKWLPSAPYVTALALLVLLQGPRLLVGPMLTALGRPRDLLLGKAAELVFVVTAIFVSGVPTLSWAIGIWIARELVSLPVTSRMVRSATTLGFFDQFRGAAVPLASSVVMAGAVLLLRLSLPPGLSPLIRLGLLATAGGCCFLLTACILDRALIRMVFRFAQSALARELPTSTVSGALVAPQSSPAK